MSGTRLAAMLAVAAMLTAPTIADAQQREAAPGGGHAAAPARNSSAHAGPPGRPPAAGVPVARAPHFNAPPSGFARGGHFAAPAGQWVEHPAWQGGGAFAHWREGHWWRGTYGGRIGAWWIVGPDWYWYPEVLAGVPDPYTPPGLTPGYWYWCDDYQQYYPVVGACPSGWQAVTPQ